MFRKILEFTSKKEGEIINLTSEVNKAVRESGIEEGLVHLFVQHSTAALTTIEFEPGVLSDLRRALSVLAPDDATYAHNARWGDGNGFSHVRASLLGPSLVVPFARKKMTLGMWQQIIVVDFDNRPRTREIFLQLLGE